MFKLARTNQLLTELTITTDSSLSSVVDTHLLLKVPVVATNTTLTALKHTPTVIRASHAQHTALNSAADTHPLFSFLVVYFMTLSQKRSVFFYSVFLTNYFC
jgi:hypothetical protein